MSLGNCIPGMVKRGEIDAQRGARMKQLFDELEAFYRRDMGPDAAAAEASEATLRQLTSEARLKKRQTLLQINRQREALKDMDLFKATIATPPSTRCSTTTIERPTAAATSRSARAGSSGWPMRA
ncbi:hypothetical protein [Sphingomonas sp. GV3]|uniref:hypothetical protein n=1 Tax=Sphingomonas sp. GV3 TaxID=3040671 RepID=UPI00280C1E98|nr:hypothetical protein [Sphingomonas sp. GV3]